MIYLSFGIHNPWQRGFKNIWNRSGKLTKNKSWEIEFLKTTEVIGFTINYTMRQDHAGFHLQLALLGYDVSLNIIDDRHWDRETENWQKHEL